MILSFIALSPLRQALAQRVAEALDDHDGGKEDDQDHAKAVVFTPANLFIHDKAQSARAHIAEDGGIAHVALQTKQGHGQIGGQHLRKNGGRKGAQARGAQRLHRLIGPHIHRFDDLKELLAHIGKRENGDGAGTGHRAEAENVRSDQRTHERRQRAHKAQKKAHEKHHGAVRYDIAGRGDGKRDRQHRADERTEEGHLDRVPQRLPDLAEIGGVRWKHRLEDIEELAALCDQHREVKARNADGKNRQQSHDHNDQRRAAALFLHPGAVRQRVDTGLEDAVVQAHTLASVPVSSP